MNISIAHHFLIAVATRRRGIHDDADARRHKGLGCGTAAPGERVRAKRQGYGGTLVREQYAGGLEGGEGGGRDGEARIGGVVRGGEN